jgi:peptide deformylase
MNFNIDELELIHFADPRMNVRPPAFDFEKDGDKAEELVDVLYKKMLQLGGVGLSANQVGLPYRMFVFGNEEKRFAMFNPNIIGASKEEVAIEEGCLSFPGFTLTLRRPAEIALEYQDEKGVIQTIAIKGVPARIVLHEYDHMEGINFTYHASNFKLKHELNKMRKKQVKQLKRMKNARKQ